MNKNITMPKFVLWTGNVKDVIHFPPLFSTEQTNVEISIQGTFFVEINSYLTSHEILKTCNLVGTPAFRSS